MSTDSTRSQKMTLTDHIRVRTRAIIDPVVTVLARLHVSPNALTIMGMLFHILFAWLIATGRMQLAGIAISLLVPLDALDGALARKLGRTAGGFGAFLDSTLDRIAEIILYVGYMIYFIDQDEIWFVAAAYVALTGSLMVSYTRSRAEALGVSCKVGLFTRVERYVVIVLSLIINRPEWGLVILAIGTSFTVIQRIYHVWNQMKDRDVEQE